MCWRREVGEEEEEVLCFPAQELCQGKQLLEQLGCSLHMSPELLCVVNSRPREQGRQQAGNGELQGMGSAGTEEEARSGIRKIL